MGYETSQFGNQVSGANVTTDVHNHYGARDTGKTQGSAKTEGFMNELTIDLDGQMVSDEAFPLLAPYLPGGCRVEDVYLEVTEAFVLGGTSPVIEIGTEGSEATNGFTITETQAEATGVYDLTSALSGDWSDANGIASDTTIGIALGGTSPTVDVTAGKARIVVRYVAV